MFSSAISSAIDEYVNTIKFTLDNLEAQDSKVVFKGTAIWSALKKNIEFVKEVSMSYLNKLKEAEVVIVNSVEKVYSSQDASVGECCR